MSVLRVFILDDFEDQASRVPAYELLRGRAEVTILKERLDTLEKLSDRLRGADAILLMRERTPFREAELAAVPGLKFISQTGRTTAHLDVAAATRRGIPIAYTPSDNGRSTTELTIGLILALLRRIPEVDRRMREESWPAVTGRMLQGKTAGVIGFGRIGRQVARILKVFDARVLAYSRTLTPEKAAEAGVECVSLETLLRESDVLSVHVPLNASTRGLIGEKELALVKPGALLVNTARGPLVSERAMVEALRSGRLGGVALDVYDVEPLPLDHPLRRFDNAILLSHRGYATEEVLRERYEQAITNILKFMDGRPVDLLNPEVLESTRG
ncbi:MAG TPA: D-2-hydroxyacid dehydrogenase family protein [candidate division Zixibacteria bacterium]|nr:D-2-hydroxyacid dehydrogenase family protein [candidate division Zixibacteria bacterium]